MFLIGSVKNLGLFNIFSVVSTFMATQVKRILKPSEVFSNILKTGRFILTLLGVDIIDKNYRMGIVTILVICSILTYWVFSIETILRLFRVRWMIILEASCLSTTVIQGSTKLFTSIRKSQLFAQSCCTLRAIFAEYENKNAASFDALHKSMVNVSTIMKQLAVWYFLSVMGIFIAPFIVLLYNGHRHLMLPFLVPFLDPDTDMGYWLTLICHIVFLFLGGFGLCIGDFVCLFLLAHIIIFVEIFKVKKEELNAVIETNSDRGRVDDLLADLIKWHQAYIDYFQIVKEFLSLMITVQIPTAGFTLGISVFIFLASDWPGAMPYIFCAFFNLYSYCILGTKVDNWNNELCVEIYNIHWYNLQVYQQKTIRLMLMKSQKPDQLKVAGFLPMSVATGLQVTKIIYTCTMLLLEFVV